MTIAEVNGEMATQCYRGVRGQELAATFEQFDLTEVLHGQRFMGMLPFQKSLPTYHIQDGAGGFHSLKPEVLYCDKVIRVGWSLESLLTVVGTELQDRLQHAMKNNTRTLELSHALQKVQEAVMALDAYTARTNDEVANGTPIDI